MSRAFGFPARARYATAACAIAAELPDADYVYRLGGPLLYFQHHRGWTHALWSLPVQAAVVTALFFVWDWTRHPRKRRWREEAAPARWGLLWWMTLAALCSHLVLDWTNNYGVRPLAPFLPRWYAGELFFIVEPVLLLVLGLALLLPMLFALVNGEIGVRGERNRGRGLAAVALVTMAGLLVQRSLTHTHARQLAEVQPLRDGAVLRSTVSPHPMPSDAWHAVMETQNAVQTGTLNVKTEILDTDAQQVSPKRPDTPIITAAKRSWLGRVYLDWSRFPEVVDAGTAAEVHPEMGLTAADGAAHVVRFGDFRFRYDTWLLRGTEKAPLGAEVWVDGSLHVRRIYFGDTQQRLPR